MVASRGGYRMARGRHYAKLSLSNAPRLSFSDLCILLLFLFFFCSHWSLVDVPLISFLSSRPRTGLATTCITGYGCCCCLLFLTFSALVANPKKLLYTVANPARGLLNKEKKKKKKSGSAPPPPPQEARSVNVKKTTTFNQIIG